MASHDEYERQSLFENEKKFMGERQVCDNLFYCIRGNISGNDIHSMFLGRYIALIIIGCVVGMIVSVLTFEPLSVQMQKLYGVSGSGAGRILFASLGAVIVGMMIVLFVLRVLRRLNDTTAVNALSGIINQRKKNKNKLCIAFVTAIAVFLMMIPSNLYSTLSSPKFVTYMGIGNADIRMDFVFHTS